MQAPLIQSPRGTRFGFGTILPPQPGDGRGPDTVNRLVLHGARHHQREAVFLHWGARRRRKAPGGADAHRESQEWQGTPDWRAHRTSTRVALALHDHLGLEKGDRVALWLPLSPEFMLIERGVWMFGGITLPLDPTATAEDVAMPIRETGPKVIFVPDAAAVESLLTTGSFGGSVRTVVILEDAESEDDRVLEYDRLVDYGRALDTPNRTSRLRTAALRIGPTDPLTLECRSGSRAACVLFDHRSMLSMIHDLADRNPPGRDVRFVEETRPLREVRAPIYASWADGISTVAFASRSAPPRSTREADSLSPELIPSVRSRT